MRLCYLLAAPWFVLTRSSLAVGSPLVWALALVKGVLSACVAGLVRDLGGMGGDGPLPAKLCLGRPQSWFLTGVLPSPIADYLVEILGEAQ